jgi:hypothetical protein
MQDHQSAPPLRAGRPGRLLGAVLLALVGLVAACSGPGAPGVVTEPGAPGRLEAAQAVVDLGRVPFHRTVEGRFELSNTGGKVVQLVGKPQVKTLEGC